MSRSTRIDDLPGPIVEIEPQITTKENENMGGSNITATIKKRVRFADEVEEFSDSESVADSVNSEINEENVLILLLLFLASMPQMTTLMYTIPFVNSYMDNSLITALIKAFL